MIGDTISPHLSSYAWRKDSVPVETKMATDVQTPPYGGSELGGVRRTRTSPLVMHLTDWRANRKNAENFHSSERTDVLLPRIS